MSQKQLALFKNDVKKQFGGTLLTSHPNGKRPLSTKNAIHLVMKSEMARGERSLLRLHNAKNVEQIVRRQATRAGLKIYRFVNVGNHLHLVLKIERRGVPAGARAYHSFIRAVSGLIARHVLKSERGSAGARTPERKRSFWQARPFTRIVSWGRDFKHVLRYMNRNRAQVIALGFTAHDPEKIVWLEAG